MAHIEEPKMPPKQDKLPEAKLDMIKKWILGGALENSGSVAKVKKRPVAANERSSGSAASPRARRRCPRSCRGSRSSTRRAPAP